MTEQLQIEIEESGTDQVTLRLEGTFNGRTAELLRRSLEAVGPAQDVVVDFTRVRSFVDLAVAVLTKDLTARPRIRWKGLAGHQERMFRYFGLSTPPAQPPRYYTPEDRLAS